MSQVNVTLNTNNIEVNTTNNQIVVTDPINPTTVNVVQPITTVVEVITAGPQGPPGTSSIVDTGSFVTTSSFNVFTSSYNTGSFTGSFTGSLLGTASWAQNAVSASYSATASYALNAGGTTIDTGSFATTGSNIFIGNQTVTGSVTSTEGFISNWGTSNNKTALFGTDYPPGVNNRQILFNDISNNDFNYPSQSINIIANIEEGFGVSLGGDPNGASIGSLINTTLNTSTIQNTSGTDFGKIQTDIGIVTLAADNGAYEQVIRLKFDNIQLFIGDKNTTEANTIELYTDRTYTKKYITTDAGFIGEYLEAPSITGSLLGTASYALNGLSASFAVSASRATTASFALTSSYSINPTISGSINNVNYIDFNTSHNATQPVAGRLSWNNSDGTLDLGMKGGNVTQQIGEEIFYEVRNETGTPISNGTLLYANGVTAGSGRITAAPYITDGSVREVRLLGMATEDISNGVNGFVTHFGYVRDLDTRGTSASSIAVGDETWAVGDILYAHPTVAGKLTNVKPKHDIIVCTIIVRHQSTGVVFVRPSDYGHLDDLHDVNINTGSLSTGDLLIYDPGSDYWTNSKQLSGSYGLTGSLHINDILQLTVRTTTPTAQEGMIIASGSTGESKLYYYNGTTWNALF